MTVGASLLSMAAAGFYLLVVCLVLTALMTARRFAQSGWHWQSWATLACLFVILVAARLLEAEDALREVLRETLSSSQQYDERRSLQRPIAAVLVALTGVLGGWFVYRKVRFVSGRRNIAVLVANLAGVSMIGLVMVRLISLSPLDSLLYGPLKMNWIGDLGFSFAVGAAALFYAKTVRERP